MYAQLGFFHNLKRWWGINNLWHQRRAVLERWMQIRCIAWSMVQIRAETVAEDFPMTTVAPWSGARGARLETHHTVRKPSHCGRLGGWPGNVRSVCFSGRPHPPNQRPLHAREGGEQL